MAAYARGKHAVGECQRCGEKVKLNALRPDGQTNLLVCADCYDEKHPSETPIRTDDAVALRRPAPDLDAIQANAIPPAYNTTLAEALGWPAGSYFGS